MNTTAQELEVESRPLLRELDDRLLDAMPSGVCVCELPSGEVVRFNRHAEQLWGRAPALGDPSERFCGAYRLLTPEGKPLPHHQSAMARVLETGEPLYDQEVIVERPDGSRRTVLASIDLVRDSQGNVLGAINVFHDITRRKQPEIETQHLLKELHAERERLIELFEHSPAFMAVLRGSEHVFERVNGHYLSLVGQREVIGKPVREALPEIDGQGFFAILDRVYATGEAFIGERTPISVQREPGQPLEERWVEFVYLPLRDSDARVTGVLVHGVDLTDRLHAEEDLARVTAESERWRRLYETILSATPDLVYTIGRDYRFTYANDALLKMWGLRWEEAIGKHFHELGYEPWHAAMHEREIDQVVATKRPVRGEVPFSGATGNRIYDYIFVPVFGADGEVEAVAGTTRDITERKALEDELQRRADALTESDRKKDEFIALLAHELRNPLAPIRNGLRVMELSADEKPATAQIRQMMDRQLGHMVRLIDDLLDVSRMNQNKLALQKQRVSLEEVISNTVEAARPAIDAAGHELVVSLPQEPVFLEADLTRLAQIFGNLLANSARYTECGGRIELTAKREGHELVVTVADNGIGIPRAALPGIFNMFSQVHRNAEGNSGGLGIGLALVKALAEMHGGSVAAHSAGPNTGSCFTVRLPALAATGEDAAPAEAPEVPAGESPRRILVVDDNHDACRSLALMLEMLGHDVHTAHNGLQAVGMAEQVAPELILMDVGMPRLNGYEATRRIRRQPWGRNTTIVALTGWGQEADRAMSKAAGCNGHLVKPMKLDDLERLLAALSENAA